MIYNADRSAYRAVKEALEDYLSEPEQMIHVLSAVIVELARDMSEDKAIRDIRDELKYEMTAEDMMRELANRS
ncbi:hypothetical protein SEA_MINIFLAYER_25 [Satellite phage MiniFlayer]|nr:hypothetical protein SEA_MINIFLAYER_25 [Satellite phage MiniFlayer]